jgi:hypothetical protein
MMGVLRFFTSLTRTTLIYCGLALFLLLQVLLVVALLDWFEVSARVGIAILFIALFLIGAGGQFGSLRIMRNRTDRHQAAKFLADREKTQPRGFRKATQRWLVWLPSAVLLLISLFIPETLAVCSHFLHRGSGRLLGYRVHIPMDWAVVMDEPDISPNHTWSVVAATKSIGLFRAGPLKYWRRCPPLADMASYGAPLGDSVWRTSTGAKITSTRKMLFGSSQITCVEYIPRYMRGSADAEIVFISCATERRHFMGSFSGDRSMADEFYRILQSARRTR